MTKIKVGILGATGAVGQHFIALLENHPWFEVGAVAASERSQKRRYREACTWTLANYQLPQRIGDMNLQPCEPTPGPTIYFSALPSAIAAEIEANYAAAGCIVISNAASNRMNPDVPLLVPEINPEHLNLIPHQQKRWPDRKGFIVTNPNCTVAGLVIPLAALHAAFGLKAVTVTTFQALSGAGYPGVASLDIIDNVIPYIRDEESKVESEPQKILGTYNKGRIIPAEFTVSAQCARVHVADGHLEAVSVALKQQASEQDIIKVLKEYQGKILNQNLPSAPVSPLRYFDEPNRPQPKFDRNQGNGMTVSVGRVRRCPVLDYKFFVLSHNMIRGAAGAAILNAELLYISQALHPRQLPNPAPRYSSASAIDY